MSKPNALAFLFAACVLLVVAVPSHADVIDSPITESSATEAPEVVPLENEPSNATSGVPTPSTHPFASSCTAGCENQLSTCKSNCNGNAICESGCYVASGVCIMSCELSLGGGTTHPWTECQQRCISASSTCIHSCGTNEQCIVNCGLNLQICLAVCPDSESAVASTAHGGTNTAVSSCDGQCASKAYSCRNKCGSSTNCLLRCGKLETDCMNLCPGPRQSAVTTKSGGTTTPAAEQAQAVTSSRTPNTTPKSGDVASTQGVGASTTICEEHCMLQRSTCKAGCNGNIPCLAVCLLEDGACNAACVFTHGRFASQGPGVATDKPLVFGPCARNCVSQAQASFRTSGTWHRVLACIKIERQCLSSCPPVKP